MTVIMQEYVDEDGQIRCEARTIITPEAREAFTRMSTVRVKIRPACAICGADSTHRTDEGKHLCQQHLNETWNWSYAVAL